MKSMLLTKEGSLVKNNSHENIEDHLEQLTVTSLRHIKDLYV